MIGCISQKCIRIVIGLDLHYECRTSVKEDVVSDSQNIIVTGNL